MFMIVVEDLNDVERLKIIQGVMDSYRRVVEMRGTAAPAVAPTSASHSTAKE